VSELPIGDLPESWRVVKLGDVCSKIGSGATPRGGGAVYVAEGTAFIRSQNVYDNELSDDGLARIDDDAAEQLKGVEVHQGDVLLNITGDSILRTCCAPVRVLPARVSQHVAIIRPKRDLDSLFLQKYLTLSSVKEYMLGHSAGGTRKAITKGHIQEFLVPMPPIAEQRAIAGVLGALDDKIESNRRKNGLLRMLIGAIYEDKECKATDFEPLTNWATLTKGTEPGRDKCNEEKLGIPFIRVGDLSRDEAALYTTFANCECADEDSVLVSFDGTPGRVATAMSGAFSSGIRRADPRSAHVSPGLLLAALESASVQRTIAEYASGTTILHAGAAIPHIRVPLWGQSQLLELSVELENLRRGIVASTRETRVLQNIRETLLPELLSGRLRVKDAEKVVEGAV
jgi:type I restriction enzyme S subunit